MTRTTVSSCSKHYRRARQVAFTADMNGNVARTYILTAQEQAQFKSK